MEKFEKIILVIFIGLSIGLAGTNFYYTYQIETECIIDDTITDEEDDTEVPNFDLDYYYTPKFNITINSTANPLAIWDIEELAVNYTGISLIKYDSSRFYALIEYLNLFATWLLNETDDSEIGLYTNAQYDIMNISNSQSLYPTNKIEIWNRVGDTNSIILGSADEDTYIVNEILYQATFETPSSWEEKPWVTEYNDQLRINFNYSLNESFVGYSTLFDMIDDHILLYGELYENSTIAEYILEELIPSISELIQPLMIEVMMFQTIKIEIGNVERIDDSILMANFKIDGNSLHLMSNLTYGEL